jgi:hypothetical protein
VAILVGSRDKQTQFWKRAIQIPFHQSLVAIGPVVSEEIREKKRFPHCYGKNSFKYTAAVLWNDLPYDFRKIANFKKHLLS